MRIEISYRFLSQFYEKFTMPLKMVLVALSTAIINNVLTDHITFDVSCSIATLLVKDRKGHVVKDFFPSIPVAMKTNCRKLISISIPKTLRQMLLEKREKNCKCIQPCPLIYALRLRTL